MTDSAVQFSLFDVLDFSEPSGIGSWTFADLREWAESFGLPWHDDEYAGAEALTCGNRFKKPRCEMTVHLGRVLKHDSGEYVPAIHFDWSDQRNGGYSGGGAAYDDVGKCAERIRAKAHDFGFYQKG